MQPKLHHISETPSGRASVLASQLSMELPGQFTKLFSLWLETIIPKDPIGFA